MEIQKCKVISREIMKGTIKKKKDYSLPLLNFAVKVALEQCVS